MSVELQYMFTASIEVSAPIVVGDVGIGHRRMIPIVGGTFEGPQIKGIVLPGGADYQLIRHDGVAEALAQYVIQTEDGECIYVVNKGFRHGPKEIMDRIIQGEPVPDGSYYFKTVPAFETASKKYACLNRMIFIGEGIRKPSTVEISFYEVR